MQDCVLPHARLSSALPPSLRPPTEAHSFCCHPCPSLTGLFLLHLSSQTVLATSLLLSLLPVPTSVTVFVSVCPAGVLSPEASPRGRGPRTLPGSNTYGRTLTAPCNSAHAGTAGTSPVPGLRLHPCLGPGPNPWRVPALSTGTLTGRGFKYSVAYARRG